MTTGGEALSWSRLAALVASTENFQPVFVNLYGLTECTIITTACQVAAEGLRERPRRHHRAAGALGALLCPG